VGTRTQVFLEAVWRSVRGTAAVRGTCKKVRQRQHQVAGIFGLAQRAPGSVFSGLEDLGQVTRVRQLAPGLHLHQRRGRRGDDRRMHRNADAGQLAQHLHV